MCWLYMRREQGKTSGNIDRRNCLCTLQLQSVLNFAGSLGICSRSVCLADYLEGVDLYITVSTASAN